MSDRPAPIMTGMVTAAAPASRPRLSTALEDLRRPVLLLFADTGGGHRSAAVALSQALRQGWPRAYAPVLLDPLGGSGSPAIPRLAARLYGPVTRWAPWLWGLLYHLSDSAGVVFVLRRTVFRSLIPTIERALAELRPGLVVVVHPLLTDAAVRAEQRLAAGVPVLTVVTDLASVHTAWFAAAERTLLSLDQPVAGVCRIGLPVAGPPAPGALRWPERAELRRRLGADPARFLVVLTGGGEGVGGLARRAAALLEAFDDIQVAVICGRNRHLQRRLARRATRWGSRLIIKGFVTHLADWFGCADLVVTKAGPATLAEATSRGAALIITSHLPGQEAGNTELAVAAGAARRANGVHRLVQEVRSLRSDPATLSAMQAASERLTDPDAAGRVASLIDQLAVHGRLRAT